MPTVKELKARAKELRIRRYSRMNKAQLMRVVHNREVKMHKHLKDPAKKHRNMLIKKGNNGRNGIV
jgi:hypothetical protein